MPHSPPSFRLPRPHHPKPLHTMIRRSVQASRKLSSPACAQLPVLCPIPKSSSELASMCFGSVVLCLFPHTGLSQDEDSMRRWLTTRKRPHLGITCYASLDLLQTRNFAKMFFLGISPSLWFRYGNLNGKNTIGEDLYQIGLNDQYNHDGVITHLESQIAWNASGS